MKPLLTVSGLSVRLPSGQALVDQVSFALERGERLGMAGPSGSGKSLTALAIAGLLPEGFQAGGSIKLEGHEILDLAEPDRARLRGQRIAMVFQEPMTALDPMRRIGRQVETPLKVHGLGTRVERRDRVAALLTAVGMPPELVSPNLFPHEISGGQRQRVLIAAALAAGPDLLVADEPTTALDSVVQRQILDLLQELTAECRLALLLISHDTRVLARICRDTLLMQNGRMVERKSAGTARVSARPECAVRDVGRHGDANVLNASHLTKIYRAPAGGAVNAVENISLVIGSGEAVGLVGASGSGKSTLSRMLAGLEQPDRGKVLLDGRERVAPASMSHSVQMVFQDPYDSLDPRWTIGRIVAEPLKAPGHASVERSRKVVDALRAVDLPVDLAARYPHMLSGGQRQRVAIARALIARPRLIILDEPLSALDDATQAQIVELLARLRRENALSYLMVSHDWQVVQQLCSRVLVMDGGRIVEAGTVEQVLTDPASAAGRALKQALLAPTVAPQ